ncbi:MAG: polysaccharide deacetylase [Ruminiclostridium sp.]|nr:polysaccharide deacetylase [Ruminiclostridium sp.]
MYFGSVKFFKHLIITIIILAILVPTGLCIYLGIQNSQKSAAINKLEAEISSFRQDSSTAFDDPEALFELYKSVEDKEAFLKLLSEYDAEMYEQFVKSAPAMNEVTTSSLVTEAPVTEETTTTASSTASETTTAVTTTAAATTTTTTTTTAAFTTTGSGGQASGSEYADLYPELYCGSTTGVTYSDDKDYVYLTFDDGPSKHTDSILYYLDKYNLKATFFVVPDGSEECAKRMRRIVDAGHTIGVHSATHDYKQIYANVQAFLTDFKICYDRIYEATGVKCSLFRFPGGSINDFNEETRNEIIAEMTRRGFVYFDWNVDSNDAGGADWTEMYVGVLGQISDTNRAVVLMHDRDDRMNTVLVLEDIIKALLDDKRGYKIDRLTEKTKPVQF